MRISALFLLLVSSVVLAEDEYSVATIVDAKSGTELRANGGLFGGPSDDNVNSITIEFDGMRYTAEWSTLLASGKNAASGFIVGSEVQALVNGKRLWILRDDDDRPLKVRIVRQEIVTD